MNVDVIGRVNNIHLPQTHGMFAIYEAIINSIQAIDEVSNQRKGYINIKFYRDHTQQELELDQGPYYLPILRVDVIDNGIGFNDSNYKAFQTSDTTVKSSLGGRGIGRFLWLKVFERVHIDSIFKHNNITRRRIFDFILTENGINNHKLLDIEEKEPITLITLDRFKKFYQKHAPKKLETLAFRILEHLLAYFIIRESPKIIIEDNDTGEKIDLQKIYNKEIVPNQSIHELDIKEQHFKLFIIKLNYSMETVHRLFYCANGRDVKNEEIREYLPLLGNKIIDDNDRQFVLLSFLTAKYLDQNVNQERTGFNIVEHISKSELFTNEQLSMDEIRAVVIQKIAEVMDDFIGPIRNKHRERIARFINEENPEYRAVLKYNSEAIDQISPNLGDEKLELELHKLNQEIELEIKQESQEWIQKDTSDIKSTEEYQKKYEVFWEKVADYGMAKLADYIVHRRIILQFLKKRLEQQVNGKYALEESIHELVFPLQAFSKDIDYSKQNLWIIDEKLAYHYFLSSDKSLKSTPTVSSQSAKRPDLIIFNNPLAFVEDEHPYSSVVIIEFKRPMREDYSIEDNPIDQVQDYIREIRSGKALDKRGRPFDISVTTPFYGYIICDVTSEMRHLAENGGYIKTPDEQGYFNFNPNLNCYIEIISFTKLLNDAQKRNRVLFDNLGLSAYNSLIEDM